MTDCGNSTAFYFGWRSATHLILGGAALQRCGNSIVLDSALAAEVRAMSHRENSCAGLWRRGEIHRCGTLFTARVSNVSGHARAGFPCKERKFKWHSPRQAVVRFQQVPK